MPRGKHHGVRGPTPGAHHTRNEQPVLCPHSKCRRNHYREWLELAVEHREVSPAKAAELLLTKDPGRGIVPVEEHK